MRENRPHRALASAQRAKEELDKAKTVVKGIKDEKLDRIIENVEAEAERLLDGQRSLRGKTRAMAGKAAKMPEIARKRDFCKLSYQQAVLEKKMEQLEERLEKLQRFSEQAAKRETIRQIREANKSARRNQIAQKMVNAVFELDAGRPTQAAKHQAKAEKGLEKVLQHVRNANDSLASDRESELRRAVREARRLEKGLEKLKDAAQQTRIDQKNARQPKAESKEKAQAEEPPSTIKELRRRELAEKLAYEIRRFKKHLEQRDLAAKRDLDELRKARERPRTFAATAARDPSHTQKLLNVLRRVRNMVEKELKSTLDAKKLFAAQREECPPQYRHLVNKYHEALSRTSR